MKIRLKGKILTPDKIKFDVLNSLFTFYFKNQNFNNIFINKN